MARLLAIETSRRVGSVAFSDGDAQASIPLQRERAHASDLVVAIERLVGDGGELDGIVVGTGPGSYTGLRVGIATALGLARGTGCGVLGVPSFEALAFAALAPGERGSVVLDARAGAYYFARYERLSGEVRELAPLAALGREELDAHLVDGEPLFCDESTADAIGRRSHSPAAPEASALLQLGKRRLQENGPQEASTLEPLYLRPFVPPARRKSLKTACT